LVAKLRAAVVFPGLVGARTAEEVLPTLIIAEPIAHADVAFRRNATRRVLRTSARDIVVVGRDAAIWVVALSNRAGAGTTAIDGNDECQANE